MRREIGITWDSAEARRGALCALPAVVIMLAVDVSLGMAFAIATIPVAMLGVPPQRIQRPRLGLVGLAFAVSYALGSVMGLWDVAAVAALTVLAFAGVVLSVRRPAAKLLPALLLPGFALGTNHLAPEGFAVAAVMFAGAAWATLITCCWPTTHPPAITPTPPERESDPAHALPSARMYGILFAAAAGIGLALGYLLNLVHVGWAAAAAMFIMRPDPGLLASRALGRTVATLAGVVAAGLLLHRGPTEVVLAIVTVATVSAMVAVRTSRWYITGAGGALIVLLISGVSGIHEFKVSFAERLLETALGAGLALTLGVAIPSGLRWLASRRATHQPQPTTARRHQRPR